MSEVGSKVVFKWGTYCRAVLSDLPEERTIYNVLPALGIEIGELPANAPNVVMLPLGPLAVYALFVRAEGVLGAFETDIDIDISMPTNEEPRIRIMMSESHEFYQLAVRLQGLALPFNPKDLETKIVLTTSLRDGENELGKIELPVRVRANRAQP